MRSLILMCAVVGASAIACRPETEQQTSEPLVIEPEPERAPHVRGATLRPRVHDLQIVAGCEPDADEMAVAADHAYASACERIEAVALDARGRPIPLEAVRFLWHTDDDSPISIRFPLGPNTHLADVLSATDMVSAKSPDEPHGDVGVCAVNDCPAEDQECGEYICQMVTAFSVVNLQGPWVMVEGPFSVPRIFVPEQDGRSWSEEPRGLKRGAVTGREVTFEWDEIAFTGRLSHDGQSMSGEAVSLMTLSPEGSWRAIRAH